MTTWREELAWSAGFYDGEGNARLSKGYGRMTVNQIDRRALERFHSAMLGVGKIYGPYQYGNYTPIYTWCASSRKDVQAVTAMLWPFLGEAKKDQLRSVLENDSRILLTKSKGKQYANISRT